MDRVSVFVDAGYLYAQGSTALVGRKQPRADLILDEVALVGALSAFALGCDPGTSLLRIYWYDGLGAGRETSEQQRIAETPNVKVRFGVINSSGQQKGVDSLIVTDLVDLARAGAIASAVVLSGDEDVRIGVEIAQRYGVRVHLLGIIPSRGSQSALMIREADTVTEWDAATVASFLTVKPPIAAPFAIAQVPAAPVAAGSAEAPPAANNAPVAPEAATDNAAVDTQLSHAAAAIAATVPGADIRQIISDWDARLGLQRPIDSRLLAHGRSVLQRDLDAREKTALRRLLVDILRPTP